MTDGVKMTLNKFNSEIDSSLKHPNIAKDVNYGTLLSWNFDHTLSSIAKYAPPKSFAILNKDLTVSKCTPDDNREFYYGVSPLLDSKMIIEAISKLKFTNSKSLNTFISEHNSLFMLHIDNDEYLPCFAKYAILSIASNYGIILNKDERLEQIRKSLCLPKSVWEENEKSYFIKGCPTEQLLKDMNQYKYYITDGVLEITDDERGKSITEIYSSVKNIQLLNGDVFYSGVLLKPNKISTLQNVFENNDIDTVCISFEKSSYATVFTLDGNFLSHPLLEHIEKVKLSEFLKSDDDCKQKLMNALSQEHLSDKERFDIVNEYLAKSYGVNQIGVSANIITNDGILLLGKRGNYTIDNGILYTSVNGNAEVSDPNVSFYKYSVYEDFPTIKIDDTRLDFLGEISREAYAELKLDIDKQDLTCVGITLTGIRPNLNETSELYPFPSRRMHFNILFETEINLDYTEVVNKSSRAAEAFENEKLLGIKVNCYKNFFSHFFYSILKFFKKFLSCKDFIEALLLIILFINSAVAFKRIPIFDVTQPISLIFAIIIVLLNAQAVIKIFSKYIKCREHLKKVTIYKNMSEKRIVSKTQKAIKTSWHPVAYISLCLYIQKELAAIGHEKDT